MNVKTSSNNLKNKSLFLKTEWGNLSAKYTGYANCSSNSSISFNVNVSFNCTMDIYFNDFLERDYNTTTNQDQLYFTYNITADTPTYYSIPVRGAKVRFKFTPNGVVPIITDTLLCVANISNNTHYRVV